MATFGNTNVEATNNNFGKDTMFLSKATMPVAGTITKLTMYVSGAGCNAIGALYNDVGNKALLAVSDPVALAAALAWTDFVFTVPYVGVAADYWFGINTDAGYGYRYVDGSGASSYKTGVGCVYPVIPDPYSGGASEAILQSAYCTYTPSGVGRVASRRLLVGVGLAAKTPQFKLKSLRLPKLLPRVM